MKRVIKLNEFFSVNWFLFIHSHAYNYWKEQTKSYTIAGTYLSFLPSRKVLQFTHVFIGRTSCDVFTEADILIQKTIEYNLR